MALIIFDFKSFSSPLARQPENMTNYTISPAALWYNIGASAVIKPS
jgi:hypothetical protein